MTRAFQLGYIELVTAKLDETLAYYDTIVGATTVERSSDGAYVSLGLDHHNIALRPGPQSALGALGLQVTGDLGELAKRLKEIGLTAVEKSDAHPGVARLLEVVAPGGHVLHLYTEMTMTAPGFRRAGVVPNRLGHVAVMSTESDRLVKLFTDVLGFRTTDWFEGVATFLTCNHDHHVLNVVAAPVSKLHHIAFELRGRTHHYDAADLLGTAGIPIVWGPARHTAGHNLASYHFDPSRFLIELYADMDVYIPELNMFEPRPWHDVLPLRPRVWAPGDLTTWGTKFDFDFRAV